MQVAITCKHGQLSANQQEYMTRKSEKLLTYFERVTAINVTVTFENGRVRAEILVDAEHKHNFVANDVGDEVDPHVRRDVAQDGTADQEVQRENPGPPPRPAARYERAGYPGRVIPKVRSLHEVVGLRGS